MVENAKEARERAAIVRGANQLVNETAAGPLIAAVEQGDMGAAIATGHLELVPAVGLMGHIYDAALADALETAGHRGLALGVRKLVALGFSVAATVQETEAAGKRKVSIDGLRLGFGTADEIDPQRLAIPLLLGAVLPPAHHWRRRATAVQTVRKVEQNVLAQVALEIERGGSRCRLDARRLVDGGLHGELAERLIAALRTRGFEADVSAGGTQLNVRWEA